MRDWWFVFEGGDRERSRLYSLCPRSLAVGDNPGPIWIRSDVYGIVWRVERCALLVTGTQNQQLPNRSTLWLLNTARPLPDAR